MIEVRAIKQSFRQHGISLFIDDIPKTLADPCRIGVSVEMITMEKDDLFKEDGPPPVVLKPQAAQKLIDDLWDCGLRPSEGQGSAGQLAAVQNHLKDFRTMLFKRLGIEGDK